MNVTLSNISEQALYDLCASMEYGNECFNSAPDRDVIVTQLKAAYKAATGYETADVWYMANGHRMVAE